MRLARISPAAQDWFESEKPGRVVHVFDRVCYLINGDGRIAAIHGRGVPLTPLSAELDIPAGSLGRHGFRSCLRADSEVKVLADRLILGPLVISTSCERRWTGKLRPPSCLVDASWITGLPEWVDRRLELEAPEGSLPREFQREAAVEIGEFNLPAGRDGLSINRLAEARIWAAAGKILRGIDHRDLHQAAAGAYDIAGIGAGLTPSGDDFLLGVFYALWLCWPPRLALHWAGSLAGAAIPRTSPLSAAWLKAGARGDAGESWQKMVEAWEAGRSDLLEESIQEIIATGHSSGADALYGFSRAAIVLLKGIEAERIAGFSLSGQ